MSVEGEVPVNDTVIFGVAYGTPNMRIDLFDSSLCVRRVLFGTIALA